MLRVGTLAGHVERESSFVAEVHGTSGLELVIRCVDRVEALAAIRSRSVDVLVAVGVPEWFDFQAVEEARMEDVALLALAGDPIEVERLEVAGFRVLPSIDELHELPELLERDAAGARDASVGGAGSGKLVAVWGAKGAPGRTTLAIELASALSGTDASTVLIDADLYGGDVVQRLGITEDLPGVVQLVREVARGEGRDPDWSSRLRRVWKGGPKLVPGLVRAELWDEVSPFGWRELVKVVRRDFDHAMCDVGFCLEGRSAALEDGPARNEIARLTLTEADQIVAVVRADPIGIKSFVWAVREHQEFFGNDDVLIVANGVRRGEEAETRRLIRRYAGRHVFAAIPDLPGQFARSVWAGVPLTVSEPAGVVAEEARRVAAALGGRVESNGLFSRLVNRRSG